MMKNTINGRANLDTRARRWSRRVAMATFGILLAVVAGAQPEGRGSKHRPEPGEKLERMERLLDLAPDQVEALEAIFESHRADTEGDREEQRANRLALKEALGADNPDALTVGELMIEGKNFREAGREEFEALQGAVAEVLTDEQQAKWEGFMRGRRGGRQGGIGGFVGPGGKDRPGGKGRPGRGGFGGPPRG